MTCKYDDYDWKELPKDVQKAAEVLGYTKKSWDNDKPCKYDDYDWDELTKEQQQAATVLGYDKAKWDSS